MKTRLLAAAAAALLAAACGGSKSSTPAASGPSGAYTGPLSSASFTASTDKSGVASLALGAGDLLGSMSSVGTMASVYGAGVPERPALVKDALLRAADLYHQPGAATVAGALTTATQACPGGGSMTVAVNRQDPAVATAGDYVNVSFAACDGGGGSVSGGSFRLTIDAASASDFVVLASSIVTDESFGVTLAFNDFATTFPADGSWFAVQGDIGLSFVATVATGEISYQIAGTSFDEGASSGGQQVGFRLAPVTGQTRYHDTVVETYTGMGTANAALARTTADLDAKLCATTLGGCVEVNTNPVFTVVEPDQYPSSGAMTISAGTDWVKLSAVDATTANVSWSIGGGTGNQDVLWSSL